MTWLLLTPAIVHTLHELAKRAAEQPLDMPSVIEQLKTPEGKAKHMDRMTALSVDIPTDFCVTFSIEHGHPIGTCRHMSMSVGQAGRVPNQPAVWIVARELGFWGSLEACDGIWAEKLVQGEAINLVQRMEPPTLQ
jgi:hypothetical protein